MRNCFRVILLAITLHFSPLLFGQTAPEISVSPSTFSFNVPTNGSASDILKIRNNGTTPLTWNITEAELNADLSSLNGKNSFRNVPKDAFASLRADNFGYYYTDSNDPGGPVFEWTDVSTVGTQLTISDEGFALISLPFVFPFYGTEQTQLQISANGFLKFGNANQQSINSAIPDITVPNSLIAPFWDDLNTGVGGGTVHVFLDTPNSRLIVQFTNVQRANDPSTRVTFQAILNPNGDIGFNYLTVTGNVNSATVGIENATGDDGLQIAFNENYVQDNLSVLITTGVSWIRSGTISGTVLPNDSAEVTVFVNSQDLAPGDYSAQFVVNSNDPNSSVVFVPVNISVGPPAISVTPTTLEFGDVLFGTSKTLNFSIQNSGDQDLVVDDFVFTGISPSDYSISSALPITISSGVSVSVPVVFEPLGSGPKQAVVNISSNDPLTPFATVALNGLSVVPDIDITPISQNFDNVTIGETAEAAFIVRNVGNSPLFITNVQLTGANASEFAITEGIGNEIEANGADTLNVSFTPTTVGVRTAAVQIGSSDPDENPFIIQLIGTGAAPIISFSPSEIDFGNVWLNTNATSSVTITNNGNAPLTIDASTLIGANANDFEIVDNNGFVLTAGESRDIDITFQPLGLNSRTAVLQVSNNSLNTPDLQINIQGFGIGVPEIVLAPTTTDFGDVPLNISETTTFNVLNNGTDTLNADASLFGSLANFSIQSGGGSFSLAPNESREIVVEFLPVQIGQLFAILKINSNDPNNPLVESTISGMGTIRRLLISPTALNFGDVEIDTSAILFVQARNPGSATVTISSLNFVGNDSLSYSISGLTTPFEILAGDTAQIPVLFAPTTVGSKSAELKISSDAFNATEVSVDLSGTGTGEAGILVSTTVLDFGKVKTGTTNDLPITITNTGLITLNISDISFSGTDQTLFSSNIDAPQSIVPNQTLTISVQFSPSTVGIKSGTLTIVSNALTQPTINIALSGEGVQPELTVSADTLNFGNVLLSTTSSQTVSLSNTGTDTLTVNAINIDGTNNIDFSLLALNLPVKIAPNGSVDLSIIFAPQSVGLKTANLTILSDASNGNSSVILNGNAISPSISASPLSVDFGSVEVNFSVNSEIIISNNGNATLNVSDINISNDFILLSDTSFSVLPSASDTVKLRFAPQTVGSFSATLSILSDDLSNSNLAIQLSGLSTPTPVPNITLSTTDINYGNVVLGTFKSESFNIKNTGTAELIINRFEFNGAHNNDYTTAQAVPFTIVPGDSKDVSVTFTPLGAGGRSGQIAIFSNDPDMGMETINLGGVGLALPELSISADTLIFAAVQPGDSSDATLTISNSGSATLNISGSILNTTGIIDFKIVGDPIVIVPTGQSREVKVRFLGNAIAGIKNANLSLTTNDPNQPTVEVALIGEVIVADIEVKPNMLTFADATINSTVTGEIIIKNAHDAKAALNISEVNFSGDSQFTLQPLTVPLTLQPGDSVLATVVFSPTEFDTVFANISIVSNDPDENPFEVMIKGNGIIPIAHDYLFFTEQRMSYEGFFRSSGNVFAGGDLTLKFGYDGIHTGDLITADDIAIRQNNTVNGDVFYFEELELTGTVNGSITRDVDLLAEELPPLSFTAGGDDIYVGLGDTLDLAPGSYGNINIEGVLKLSSGSYFFNELVFEIYSQLNADVSDGVVEINIVGFTDFKRFFKTEIFPEEPQNSQKLVWKTQHDEIVEISRNSIFLGTLIAPDAFVKIEREVLFRGAVCANRIIVKEFAYTIHHTSPEVLPADSTSLSKLLGDRKSLFMPQTFELAQNFPNPFNPVTTIRFSVANAATPITIRVYDITGRLVSTLVNNEVMEVGAYNIEWNGRDSRSQRVASGVYIYRMTAGDFKETRKMLLVK